VWESNVISHSETRLCTESWDSLVERSSCIVEERTEGQTQFCDVELDDVYSPPNDDSYCPPNHGPYSTPIDDPYCPPTHHPYCPPTHGPYCRPTDYPYCPPTDIRTVHRLMVRAVQ